MHSSIRLMHVCVQVKRTYPLRRKKRVCSARQLCLVNKEFSSAQLAEPEGSKQNQISKGHLLSFVALGKSGKSKGLSMAKKLQAISELQVDTIEKGRRNWCQPIEASGTLSPPLPSYVFLPKFQTNRPSL